MSAAIKPNTQEWLAERRKYLCASDAPAALGLSPWKSPLQVYLDKTGQLPEEGENDAMRRGQLLEYPIRRAYEIATGNPAGDADFCVSAKYPWMACTPDAVLENGSLLEIKTVNAFRAGGWGSSGTDQIPEYYCLQVLHQLIVTDQQMAFVCALIASEDTMDALCAMVESNVDTMVLANFIAKLDLRIYEVWRNADLEAQIIELEREFWESYVLAHVPPSYDGSAGATEYLKRKFPNAGKTIREASLSEATLLADYQAARAAREKAETEEARLEQEIVAAIGDDLGIATAEIEAKYGNVRGRKTTDWKAVCAAAKVPQSVIDENTTEGEPTRRLTVKELK